MKYWLMKSEPDVWSWAQQVKKGVEPWTGVRNHQAANNMRAMELGDKAFFYHSNEGREIVGIVTIVKKAYLDPTDEKEKFVCVDVKADVPFEKPVTLADIKADPKLKDMALVKLTRLSVQPVSEAEWKHICKKGGVA